MALSESTKNIAREAVNTRLNQIDGELNAKASDYEVQVAPLQEQIHAFNQAFENACVSLNAEREQLQADLAELNGEIAG